MTAVDTKPVQQSQPSSVRRWSSSRTQNILLCLILVVGVVAIYFPVHWQPFANYDDPDYVTDNIHVKAGLHWQTVCALGGVVSLGLLGWAALRLARPPARVRLLRER